MCALYAGITDFPWFWHWSEAAASATDLLLFPSREGIKPLRRPPQTHQRSKRDRLEGRNPYWALIELGSQKGFCRVVYSLLSEKMCTRACKLLSIDWEQICASYILSLDNESNPFNYILAARRHSSLLPEWPHFAWKSEVPRNSFLSGREERKGHEKFSTYSNSRELAKFLVLSPFVRRLQCLLPYSWLHGASTGVPKCQECAETISQSALLSKRAVTNLRRIWWLAKHQVTCA